MFAKEWATQESEKLKTKFCVELNNKFEETYLENVFLFQKLAAKI